MLQWMGGSRRKVTTSRKSTQKRQKQYFEQRKHQQQKMQMTGSDSCSKRLGISGQYLKEHRSLDILNLLNLSTYAQQSNSACLKGREDVEVNVSAVQGNMPTKQPTVFTRMAALVDSCRYDEARVPLGCQIEKSPKKVLVSAPDGQTSAFNGTNCKQSHRKTVTEQHSELSVFDLLYNDEHNPDMEECPTCEDHVAFSLEGLGKLGTGTPVHSPQQQARTPCGYSPLLKDGRKTKLSKSLNNVLEGLDLEVDAIMKDFKVIRSSSNFPYKKGNQSLSIVEGCKHYGDHNNTDGSSINQEFYYDTENNNEDMWNAGFGVLDEKFENEREFEDSWEKKFQVDTSSPDLLKNGGYETGTSCVFDDLLPKKRNSVTAMEDFNMIELPASYSKFQSENDFDYFVATGERCFRSDEDENFIVQNLVTDDVRDNSSLLSEESCSSTAVRGEAIKHSPSRLIAGENRSKHRNDFANPGNKCSSKKGKCGHMSNPSKRKPSHYSNSILQEELGTHNSWKIEERYATIKNSGATSFCQNLETKFAVSGSKNRTEDPFRVFTIRELHKKASPSFGGFKNDAPVSDPSPCNFTSEKFAFADSPVFANVGSWPTGPKFSQNFQFNVKPQNVTEFHFETPDTSVQESISKAEGIEVKLEQDSCRKFEPSNEKFLGDNGLSSEKKMGEDASTSI